MPISKRTAPFLVSSTLAVKMVSNVSKGIAGLTFAMTLSVSLYSAQTQATALPEITLNAQQIEALAIQTQRVESVQRYPSRQYVAQSIVPYDQVYAITMPVDGQISKLHHFQGRVQQGETIATVHSTELLKLQSELIGTLADLKAEMSALKRATTLSQSGAVSNKQRQQLEANVQKLLQTKSQQIQALRYVGMKPELVDKLENTQKLQSGTLEINAPVTGELFDLNAQLGKRLMAQDNVISLAKIDPIVIGVDVPAEEAKGLKKGQSFSIIGREKAGTVTYVSEIVDPMTQSIAVHTRFENSDLSIKPGTLFKVQFEFEQPVYQTQMGALTRIKNQPMIFVKQGDRIQAVDVEVLQTQDNLLYFLPKEAQALTSQSLIIVHGTATLKNSLMAEEGEE